MFSILEPNLLVPQEAEAKELEEAMNNDPNPIEKGIMASMFDYSEEQEKDTLGAVQETSAQLSLEDALQLVRKVLKHNKP
jgi:hypothetical protein